MRSLRLVDEAALIPYRPAFPPGQRWLFLAPHPDDEALGAGATLALANERGVDVRVVVVTSGGAQGDPAAREAEAVASARALGLAAPTFWRMGDRALAASLANVVGAVVEAIASCSPDTVFVTSPVELHPDHRALALAVRVALRRITLFGVRRRPPAWVAAYEVSAAFLPNLLVDADSAWERKRQAIAAYSSQLAHRPYDRVAEAIGVLRSLTLEGCAHAEGFRVLPAAVVARRGVRAWAAAMGSPRGVAPR